MNDGARRVGRAIALATALAGSAAACGERPTPHEHASEHPEGHDHHAEGHGHGDALVVRQTRFGDGLEVFAEHEAAVVGEETEMVMHITVLDGFRPLTGAEVRLELEGAESIRAPARAGARPGVYVASIRPRAAGTLRGTLVVTGPVTAAVGGVDVEVHADAHAAREATAAPREGYIELLKEQQWGVPFGTAPVARGVVIPTLEVRGTVVTPPNGSAAIGAPVAGRIGPPRTGFPLPGATVRRGDLLATLAPAPSSPEESARASLAVTEAETRVAAARTNLERAARLVADQAISVRELEDARRELEVAEQAVRSARGASRIFAGAASGTGAGAFRLIAPIDGVVAEVHASAGESVGPEDVLFRIVDPSELWIRARIPEQDAAHFRADADAAYQIAGLDGWAPIDVTGEDARARVVSVGRTVDPATRTVEVLYAFAEPDPRLRIGGLVQVALPVGAEAEGLVVPTSAIIDDDGRTVVYVQVDGEHFEQRLVRLGPREGGRAIVLEGVSEGERVVVRGAHVVRLADRPESEGAHGHIH